MKLKEFLKDKTLTAVEIVNVNGNVEIMNVCIGSICYGLNIDTSNIPSGTTLDYRTDFVLENDILSVDNIILNTNDVEMLGM